MMLRRNAVSKAARASRSIQRRLLSARAANILAAVDIEPSGQPVPGVYDGQWHGSGEVYESVCPATGEVLAHVQSVRNSVVLYCVLVSSV